MAAIFIASWKFLRSLPWQVWAIIAVIAAAYFWGERRHNSGVAAERARWEAAQVVVNRKSAEAQARRDKIAGNVNAGAGQQAQAITVETRTQTATAVERVKHGVRTIVVPGNCPTALPASVQREGRAAVDRARAAGSQVRASIHR